MIASSTRGTENWIGRMRCERRPLVQATSMHDPFPTTLGIETEQIGYFFMIGGSPAPPYCPMRRLDPAQTVAPFED